MTIKNPYPTPVEILKVPVSHRKETLKFMEEWKIKYKQKGYRTDSALADLLFGLAKLYGKNNLTIIFADKESYYTPNCIHLGKKSVITALHELAHHLYGTSEKTACRWSVWLFKKIFPEEFEKLTFKGHLLVANNKNINNPPTICLLTSPPPKIPGLRRIMLPAKTVTPARPPTS